MPHSVLNAEVSKTRYLLPALCLIHPFPLVFPDDDLSVVPTSKCGGCLVCERRLQLDGVVQDLDLLTGFLRKTITVSRRSYLLQKREE